MLASSTLWSAFRLFAAMLPLTATSLEQLLRLAYCERIVSGTYCWFSGRPGVDSAAACCPPRKRWFWGVHSCLSYVCVCIVLFSARRFFLSHTTNKQNPHRFIYHISRPTWHPSRTHTTCPPFYHTAYSHTTTANDDDEGCCVKWCTRTSLFTTDGSHLLLNKPSLICNGLHLPTSYH